MNIHKRRDAPAARTERGERTRAAIAAAACRLFAERSYAAVAVPDIADAVGVAPATLYRHFESKEDLVNQIFSAAKAALMDALTGDIDDGDSPRQRFSKIWRGLARFAADHPDEFAFLELHHHAPYLDEENQRLERESLALFVDLLAVAGAAGVLRPLPPAAIIAMTWGAWSGLVKAARLGHLSLDDATVDACERAAWSAIAIEAGGAESQ